MFALARRTAPAALLVGAALCAVSACSSTGTADTAGAAAQQPHAKKVDPIPDCTTLTKQQDYAAALGKPVRKSATPADEGTDSCTYDITGGFIGVSVMPTQPAARTTPTTFDGNKATTSSGSVNGATSCALNIVLNPKNSMVLNVNTQTSDKSVDACAVTKKLAGTVFSRIPDA